MGKTFSPKQVARALSVSESTLKRWCDQGTIQTVRTAGGHRRIALPDILAFLQTGRCQLEHPELLQLPAISPTQSQALSVSRKCFRDALVAGQDSVCRQVVFELTMAGHSLAEICDDVIAASMNEIGELWACGAVDVYQERVACDICSRVLIDCEQHLPAISDRQPLAIGGALEHDPYTLPTRMVALALREAGWRSVSLGNMLPLRAIGAAIQQMRPKLAWISLSTPDDAEDFVNQYATFEESIPPETKVVVGGRGLDESLRAKARGIVFCSNLQQLTASTKDWFRASLAT